jgi:hypothetical protein
MLLPYLNTNHELNHIHSPEEANSEVLPEDLDVDTVEDVSTLNSVES